MIATLANSAWLASCIPEYLRFRKALGRVRTEQEGVLRGILRKNQASAFGRRHRFSAIRTVRDYQRRVPLSDYDDYRARVARIAEGETQVLTCERVRYARADDLADENTTALMKAAGAHQVQIGLESGDQGQLNNMDKACTVESNARAIDLCRKHGLTTVASFIVGFPGETRETLNRTLDFMRSHPPLFFFPLLSARAPQGFRCCRP